MVKEGLSKDEIKEMKDSSTFIDKLTKIYNENKDNESIGKVKIGKWAEMIEKKVTESAKKQLNWFKNDKNRNLLKSLEGKTGDYNVVFKGYERMKVFNDFEIESLNTPYYDKKVIKYQKDGKNNFI